MLKQKITLAYSSNIILQLIQIIASIVVARVAGATVLGTVAFGTAFVSTFIFIADLGIGTAHIKLISSTKDNLDRYIGTYALIKSIFIGFFILVILGFYIIRKFGFGYEFESHTHEQVVFITLIALTVQELFSIPKATFSGKLEVAKRQVAHLTMGILYNLIRIIVVLLGFGAVAIAFGKIAASLMVIPLFIYFFKTYKIGKPDKRLIKKYLSISVPVILIGASTKLSDQLDKVLLQFFTNSENVGYYTAGFRFGGMVKLIGVALGSVLMPDFSRSFAKNDPYAISRKIYRFERFSYIFILPGILIVAILSDVIVKFLLGVEFEASVPIMTVITLATFIYIMGTPMGSVITGAGKFKLAAIINSLKLAVFLIFAVLLVHPDLSNMQGLGMALAFLIANVLLFFLNRRYSKSLCSPIDNYYAIPYLIIGALFFTGGFYIYQQFCTTPFLKISFTIGFITIYFAVYYIFNLMKKNDLKELKNVISLGKMSNYIKDELGDKEKNNNLNDK